MDAVIIVLLILILAAVAVAIFIYFRSQSNSNNSNNESQNAQALMVDLNDKLRKEVEALREKLDETGNKSRKEIQDQLDKINTGISNFQKSTADSLQNQFTSSQKIIKEVTEKLTKIEGTNQQVLGFAEQMRSLENILQNPKQRGVLGEYFLEALLSNILQPNQYKMQYKFSNGEIVDAAIFYKDKIIPVDSKFSLEKYNRMVQTNDKEQRQQLEKEFKADVKMRIDETSKYIRTNEDTTEFAFMFIPAEGVYYNLLIYNVGTLEMNTQDLIEYAFNKHVVIVSPTSFYAYLETVLQGLKAIKIEESVKDVIKRVNDLGRHLNQYEDYMSKVGKHLGTTVNMFNDASKEFKKIDKDVLKITDGNAGGNYDRMLIDKPAQPSD